MTYLDSRMESMLTVDNALLLIDDELVAISAKESALWPTVTPTVLTRNQSQYSASINRGVKSLIMRGIIKRDGKSDISTEVMNHVNIALLGKSKVSCFVATHDLQYDTGFSTTVIYEHGGQWLGEVITPLGVHYLFMSNKDDIQRLLLILLNGSYQGDVRLTPDQLPEGNAPHKYLFFLGMTEDNSARIVRVQTGDITIGSVRNQGEHFQPAGSVQSGIEALNYLSVFTNS